MSYQLRKTNKKKGLYLQIYSCSYSGGKYKNNKAVCFKTLGFEQDLIEQGIKDPVKYYSNEVKKLNDKLKKEKEISKVRTIGKSPVKHVGHFPVACILNKLSVESRMAFLQEIRGFQFDIFSILSDLVYSRLIEPASKNSTFHDTVPYLFNNKVNYSYDQMLSACNFLGQEYEKIIEIFNVEVAKKYGIDTTKSYFDCTNFYFEIDKEDIFRRNGPSKENKKNPIVGLGLLLDANKIPIGMKLFPGNQSERPVLRDVVTSLKRRNNIIGRTIHVADKGLNSAENIVKALKDGDGYIFSKSVKQLSGVEKVWVTHDKDFKEVYDKNEKLLYKYKSCIEKFPYVVLDENGKRVTVHLKEKRVLTYNPSLAKKKIYEINKMVDKISGYCNSQVKKMELGDAAKYAVFYSTSNGKITADKVVKEVNLKAVQEDIKLAGYNLIVTSEIDMKAKDIYDTYHELWRIEETFRVMKTDLDARPVFLQKENSIKGHFLVCYLAVLLLRILQFKILSDEYSSREILYFIKNFKVINDVNKTYINITEDKGLIRDLKERFDLPITNYYLTEAQIKNFFKKKF